MKFVNRIYDIVTVVLFVAAICVPVCVSMLGSAPLQTSEKRELAAAPRMPRTYGEIEAFPRAFEAWFDDRFGLRQDLVSWHNSVRYRLLGVGDDQVIVGKDGWLFYAESARTWRQEARLYTSSELAFWARTIKERREFLARRGIAYLFFAAPAKTTIYPDYLPDRIRPARRPRRLEQLDAYFRAANELSWLDTTSALRDQRERLDSEVTSRDASRRLNYWPLDTHWNHLGAFSAYSAVMTRLVQLVPEHAEELEPYSEDRGSWTERQYDSGRDLAEMLGLSSSGRSIDYLLLPDKLPTSFPQITPLDGSKDSVSTWDRSGLPRAYLLHDSFLQNMQAYLSAHFSAAYYRFVPEFDLSKIDAVRPRLVIEECAERLVVARLPQNPIALRLVEDVQDRASRESRSARELRGVATRGGLTILAGHVVLHEDDAELELLWHASHDIELDHRVRLQSRTAHHHQSVVRDLCPLRTRAKAGQTWRQTIIVEASFVLAERVWLSLIKSSGENVTYEKNPARNASIDVTRLFRRD
ncbi:MAG: hypothetical protein H6832_17090 [Planctomycetes bacterium]|nr:hypothetical protein [Planctomycetota bacterium]MCB9920119.1 hypothetical protein [Planctomycetota bacterium]